MWRTRTSTGEWRPVGVFMATRRVLTGRALPGDEVRSRWFESIITDAQRPARADYSPERGSWEDWIGWALGAFSNGHDTMMAEVDPEPTVDMLYQREVLAVQPTLQVPDAIRPSEVVPPLTGRKSSDIRPTQPEARA